MVSRVAKGLKEWFWDLLPGYILLGACIAVMVNGSIKALFYFLFGGTILLPLLTAGWLDIRMVPRVAWLSEDSRRFEGARSGSKPHQILGTALGGPFVRVLIPVLLFPLLSIVLAIFIHWDTGVETEDRAELGRALIFFVLLLAAAGLFSWCGVLGRLTHALQLGAGKRRRRFPLSRWTVAGISLAYGIALTCCVIHFTTGRPSGEASGIFSRYLTWGLVALIGAGLVIALFQWLRLCRIYFPSLEGSGPSTGG